MNERGFATKGHKGNRVSLWLLCSFVANFSFFLSPPVSASPPKFVDISARVDKSEITIGDRLRYEIQITYPDSGRIELPSVLGNLGAFEVKDYQTEMGKAAGNRAVSLHVFSLSTFTVGTYTLPPQRIEYRAGKDTTPMVLYTQPTEIHVKRTSPETVKDIADIADVVEIPRGFPWGLAALGSILLALIGFFLWRKLRSGMPAELEKPRLPPYEEAKQRLAVIDVVQLLRQNRAREFAFQLSEIFRNYVGRRYGVDALESTTDEFMEKAAKLPLAANRKIWMGQFCESLDTVKFATSGILETEAERLVSETLEFLEETKPAPEPEK